MSHSSRLSRTTSDRGMRSPGVKRRRLFVSGAAACLLPLVAIASAGPELIVAGPDGSALDGWAAAIAPALASGLAMAGSLRVVSLGGLDGVTGANQFEAHAVPDGKISLLVPGQAAIAWLAGDPRVQFDPARWVTLLAGTGSGVVVGRVDPTTWTRRRNLRLATTGPVGPGLAMMLAFDILGLPFIPVFGFTSSDARAAWASGRADVVLLSGADVPTTYAKLAGEGARPLFTFGSIEASGEPTRDPLFPDVPHFAQLHSALRGAAPSGPLYEAWRATALAAQMTFGLVLPQLTPAPVVALWRRAAAQAIEAPQLQTAVTEAGLRTLAPPPAAAVTAVLAVSPDALMDLRTWLADRWHYPPA